MEVAVAYDLRSEFSLTPEDPEDLLEEYDSPETIDAIELAVEYRVPPDLPFALVRRALDLALDAYRILGCRDVARIDLRVDRRGEPSFLEANPMPDLHPEKSDLVILGRESGLDYNGLVGRIVSSARARHGI